MSTFVDSTEIAGSPSFINDESHVTFEAKWKTEIFVFEGSLQMSISEIKHLLFERTSVPCERQKLLGIIKPGKRVDESIPMNLLSKEDLSLKPNKDNRMAFTMLGTPDSQMIAMFVSDSSVVNDFSMSCTPVTDEWKSLQKHIELTEINFITYVTMLNMFSHRILVLKSIFSKATKRREKVACIRFGPHYS